MEKIFFGLDLLPSVIEIGLAVFETGNNSLFVLGDKAGKKIKKRMSVATDKINILVRDVKFILDINGDIFPPSLNIFVVVDPGAGKLLKTEIESGTVNSSKAKFPTGAKSGSKRLPIFWGYF